MDFDDELFGDSHERTHLTRRQKRYDRRQYTPIETLPKPKTKWEVLNMTTEELRDTQLGDPTLATAQVVADGNLKLEGGEGFYWQNGLLYWHWVPKAPDQRGNTVKQLVIPSKCHNAVVAVAHEMPFGGHLGKTKTTQRLLQRFYWPTLHSDVAKFNQSYKACQMDSSRRVPKAPLIPLPIISEPFRRIAMDIVGPLPKSRSGK